MKFIVIDSHDYELPYETQPERGIFPYLDLRTHPELIDTIPEIQRAPPLKAQVAAFNDPLGSFMTHGCAFASKPPGALHPLPIPETASAAPFWCSTYVLFSFWLLNDNATSHYQEMHDSYSSDRTDYSICFEVQSAYFWTPEEIRAGFRLSRLEWRVCLLWASGWGSRRKPSIIGRVAITTS